VAKTVELRHQSVADAIPPRACAIYLWDDSAEPAVCLVTRHGRLGWSLSEALGPSNAELDGKQLQEVTTAFVKAAVRNIPLFVLSNAFCRRTTKQGLVRRDSDSMIWNSGYGSSKRQLGSKMSWMRSLEMWVLARPLQHYLGHKNIQCTIPSVARSIQADAVDLRAGKPSSFRVLASSCQYSPHALNRSLR